MEIVGSDNYSDKLIDRVAYSYDGSYYSHRPDCAVWVNSAEQISQLLIFANQEKIPVVPRGAGTGISGNAIPVKGGIVLDLSRMNRILSIRIPDRLAVVEPGVVYDRLQTALVPHGFFFPPDPASGKVCTLGGNVGTNAGGLRAAKYGTTREYVLGLQVVLANGEIMRTGARTMKTSSGYDLTRLFTGSEGTLGVFTEITLKIAPKPIETATAMAVFDRLESAGEAVTRIMQSDITPSALELFDTTIIRLLQRYTDGEIPPAAAIILAETDGSTRQVVDHQMKQLVKLFQQCRATSIELAETDADAERLWQGRKDIAGMMGELGLTNIPEDLTVPMSRIAEYLARCQNIAKKHELQIINFGHAGDGNFHTNILYKSDDPEEKKRIEPTRRDLHELACSLGGTLTGEHGIGITKAGFMDLEHDPAALKVMRLLKNALDPNHILNPGKLDL